MSILAVRRVIRATGIPYKEWHENRYALCLGILKRLDINGVIVFGMGAGKTKHCWIKSDLGELIDPIPDAYNFGAISFLYPYDAYKGLYIENVNMSALDFIGHKCPPMTKNGKRVRLFIDTNRSAFRELGNLTGYNQSCTINVLTWIANVPVSTWGKDLVYIYDGIIRSGFEYLIPDNNMALYKKIAKIGVDDAEKLKI